MKSVSVWAAQLLFGWMNLVLAVPSIYLMLGMPLVMRQHGWSGTEIGLFQLAALPAIFKLFLAVPVQRLRFGTGHFVNWLWLMAVLLVVLYLAIGRADLINERMLLFTLTFAISIVATWMDIPLNALAIQYLPRTEQLRAGSIRSAALFLGAIVGAGVMVLVQARWGWQAPFLIMGVALLIGCIPFAFLRAKAGLQHESRVQQHTGLMADWASFFSQEGAKQWTSVLLTSFPFIGAVWFYLKPLMLDQGMPLEEVAWTVGIAGGVTGALFSLVGGRLAAFLGAARAIPLYLLTALLSLVLLTVAVWAKLGATWLVVIALCIAASMGAVSALLFGLTMFFTRRQRNASDYGLQSTLFTLTRMAVPVIAGVILDHFGQVVMLSALSLGVLLAFVLAWRVRHSVGESTEGLLRNQS